MSQLFKIISLGVLVIGLVGTPPLQAQLLFFWNGSTSSDFSIPDNWADEFGNPGFPMAYDTASIQNIPTSWENWQSYIVELGTNPPPNDIDNLWIGADAYQMGDVIVQPAGPGWLKQTDQTLNVGTQVVIGGLYDPSTDWSTYEISGGTLNVAPTGGNGNILVGPCWDYRAFFMISGTANVNINPPDSGTGWLTVGNHWGATAMIYQSGESSVHIKSGILLGYYDPATTGYYNLSGGTLTVDSAGGAALEIGNNGNGLFEQSGGTVTVAGRTRLAYINPDIYGVLNISGGTYQNHDTIAQVELADAGTGIINLSGSEGNPGVFSTQSDICFGVSVMFQGTGIANLGTGGTLQTTGMFKKIADDTHVGAKLAQLNFHGGTLKAVAENWDFLNSGSTDAPVDTYVYPEGGIIDTQDKTVVIRNPLMAPTGNGLSNVTVVDNENNYGYTCPPIVEISRGEGDTTGEGATAIAEVEPDPNSEWYVKIKDIKITNPGVGYTQPPVITLMGGGQWGNWTHADTTTEIAPNSNTGGITKIGSGILGLTGINTYAGETKIDEGTLVLAEEGQINPASKIVNNAEFVILDYDGIDVTPHTVGEINGTGNTTLYDGTTLTTSKLVQNSLTVNIGAKLVIVPTGGGGAAPAPVPEPSTLALLALAGLGVLLAARRRKSS